MPHWRLAWTVLRSSRSPLAAVRLLRLISASPESKRMVGEGPSPRLIRSGGRHFVDLYVPGWPSRAFDRFVAHEFERVRLGARPAPLQTAVVAVTRRCSLVCEHCFEWDALAPAETLTLDDLHEILRRVRRLGASQVFLSGGEPLLRFPDVLSLARAASDDCDLWVLTSGRGLSSSRARELRAAGVTGVAVSLDHWRAAEHDRFRGAPGVFDAAMRATDTATQAGLVLAWSLCPTRAFVSEENLARYAQLAGARGATFIQVLEPKARGRYAGQNVSLTQVQGRMLDDFTARANAADAAPGTPIVAHLDRTARHLGCTGAADRHLYVSPTGALQACPFCAVPGPSALDRDFDAAVAALRRGGCGAGGCTAGEPPRVLSAHPMEV